MQNQDSRPIPADKIIALPSLSCSLSSLPQAKSIDSISLHPAMSAQRAAESEAKLLKVLSKTASSYSPQNPPLVPSYAYQPQQDPQSPNSTALMMRTSRPKFQT